MARTTKFIAAVGAALFLATTALGASVHQGVCAQVDGSACDLETGVTLDDAPVVTTTKSQTLTNKEIDGDSNQINIRTHATDCTTLADGKEGELCLNLDDYTLFKCVPDAGDCSGTEWRPQVPTGSSRPENCTVGMIWTQPANPAGQKVSLCTAVNTWSYIDSFLSDGEVNTEDMEVTLIFASGQTLDLASQDAALWLAVTTTDPNDEGEIVIDPTTDSLEYYDDAEKLTCVNAEKSQAITGPKQFGTEIEFGDGGGTWTGANNKIIKVGDAFAIDQTVAVQYYQAFNPTITWQADPTFGLLGYYFAPTHTSPSDETRAFGAAQIGYQESTTWAPDVTNGSATLAGHYSYGSSPTFDISSGTNDFTVSNLYHYNANTTVNDADTTLANRYGFRFQEATGTGTVTNQYGLHIPALSKGTLNVGIYNADTTVLAPQTVTCADTEDANPCTTTISPGASYVEVTCADEHSCDITLGETSPVPQNGQTVIFVCKLSGSGTTCDFADTAGVSELAGALSAGANDSISMIYASDRWVETSRSNN